MFATGAVELGCRCAGRLFAQRSIVRTNAVRLLYHRGGILVSLRWYSCTTAVVLRLVFTDLSVQASRADVAAYFC